MISKRLFLSSILFLSGCASFGTSIMPSKSETSASQWQGYDATEKFYDSIKPFGTTLTDLKKNNFDPKKSANVTILSYVDILNMFLISPSVKIEDLPFGIQDCLKERDTCLGYKVGLQDINTNGEGNVISRFLKFKKKDRKTGWEAKFYFFTRSDLVVYKFWGGGTPNIDQLNVENNPLGPFQEPLDLLIKYAPKP